MIKEPKKNLVEFVDSITSVSDRLYRTSDNNKMERKIKRLLNEVNFEFVEYLSFHIVSKSNELQEKHLKVLETGVVSYTIEDHMLLDNWKYLLTITVDHLTIGGALRTENYTDAQIKRLNEFIADSVYDSDVLSRLRAQKSVSNVMVKKIEYDCLIITMLMFVSGALSSVASSSMIFSAAFMSNNCATNIDKYSSETAQQEMEDLRNKLKDTTEALSKLLEEHEEQDRNLTLLYSDFNDSKKEVSSLMKTLQKRENKISQLEKQILRIKEENKDKIDRNKLSNLKDQIYKLTLENVKIKTDNNSLLMRVANLEQSIDDMTMLIDKQRNKLAEYQEDEVFLGYIDSVTEEHTIIKSLNKPNTTNALYVERGVLSNVLKGQVVLVDANAVIHKVYQQYFVPGEINSSGTKFVSTDALPRNVTTSFPRLFMDGEKIVAYSEAKNEVVFVLRPVSYCRNNHLKQGILCPPNKEFSMYYVDSVNNNKTGNYALLTDLLNGGTTIVPVPESVLANSFIAYSEDLCEVLYTWYSPFQSGDFPYWESSVVLGIADTDYSVIILDTEERIEVTPTANNYFKVGDVVSMDVKTSYPISITTASKIDSVKLSKKELTTLSKKKDTLSPLQSVPIYMTVGIIGNPYNSISYINMLNRRGIDVIIADGYDSYKSILRRVRDCDLVVFCPTFMSHEVNYTLKKDNTLPNVVFSKNDGASYILSEIRKWEERNK